MFSEISRPYSMSSPALVICEPRYDQFDRRGHRFSVAATGLDDSLQLQVSVFPVCPVWKEDEEEDGPRVAEAGKDGSLLLVEFE